MQRYKNKYFLPYSSCFFVKGYNRGIIYDSDRQIYKHIPNALVDIVNGNKGKKTISEIKFEYPQDTDTIDEYFSFLLECEYIFFVDQDEISLFPEIDLSYHSPCLISNSIIDIGEEVTYDLRNTVRVIVEELGCRNIQIRSYFAKPLEYFEEILSEIYNLGIRSIELWIKYTESIKEEELIRLVNRINNVSTVLIHSSPVEKKIKDHFYGMRKIHATDKELEMGKIYFFKQREFFVQGLEYFVESNNRNAYFNQKLYISSDGIVKNAPESEIVFGKISENLNKLPEIVSSEEFRSLWYVKKDLITVCKDCEYRYMCFDNRLPVKKDDEFCYASFCNYNPYISKWSDEIGYISLSK